MCFSPIKRQPQPINVELKVIFIFSTKKWRANKQSKQRTILCLDVNPKQLKKTEAPKKCVWLFLSLALVDSVYFSVCCECAPLKKNVRIDVCRFVLCVVRSQLSRTNLFANASLHMFSRATLYRLFEYLFCWCWIIRNCLSKCQNFSAHSHTRHVRVHVCKWQLTKEFDVRKGQNDKHRPIQQSLLSTLTFDKCMRFYTPAKRLRNGVNTHTSIDASA